MTAINWNSGDVDAAFALAAEQGKPLFLYWGATWCPPCNRLKGSIFTRPDFIALSSSFVPLQIDGDSIGAQKLAERFKLRSYPTLIVFRPDGSEVTRLPCEVDGARFVELLALALSAPFTIEQSLAAVLSGARTLSDDEWHLLSFYSWSTDEQHVLKNHDLITTLGTLTRTCTLADASTRFGWHALYAASLAGRGDVDPSVALAHLSPALADKALVRAQMDIVIHYASDLVRYLTAPQSRERTVLTDAWAEALEGLESDPELCLTDHLAALRARVRVSRLGTPIPGLTELARTRVANAARTINEPATRHFAVNTAAGVLSDAGLLTEAESLLLAELNRSHSPFYFMHNLATLAKKRGDPLAAVSWYEQAWKLSTGSATRLQWGTTYLHGLIDIAPHDTARIEQVARVLLKEAGETRDAYYQRNRTQMQRIDRKLATWGEGGEYSAALRQAARAIRVQ